MIIEYPDFKHVGVHSYDLLTEGSTLEELLDNAKYVIIDPAGGPIADVPANDGVAIDYISYRFLRG